MKFKELVNTLRENKATELLSKGIKKMLSSGLLIISLLAFLGVLAELGFKLPISTVIWIHFFYVFCIASFLIVIFLRMILVFLKKPGRQEILVSEYFLFIVLIILLILHMLTPKGQDTEVIIINVATDLAFMRFTVILLFIIEVSKSSLKFQRLDLNPALLFTGSFLLLILIGTILLMLPRATSGGISLIDAVFTSTSAVCVTGLIVVDTATHFTQFGKFIILILIQFGGLGIMTFTSFFGFFFKSSSSFENTLFIQEFINENRISQIFKTIVKVIGFTLLIELIGAVLVYSSVVNQFPTQGEAIWFSVFHSISAFCNAGFSTLTNGLYEPIVRTNYTLHMIIAVLIVLGGVGFPVILNLYNSTKYFITHKFYHWTGKQEYAHRGRHLTIHSKVVLVTTGFLLLFGFIMFFWAEYNNSLKGLSWYGKLATSVFGSVTPRTAGFNTVDMSTIAMPTVLVYLILMWIGASPGSTGGGLKTSTFAVGVLNAVSIAKHKERVEVFKREITNDSVRKAFAVVFLSFLVIGLSVFLVALFNPELPLVSIAFECFSAFSTVGLTLGITAALTTASKSVIILTMFLGRVGILMLLIALVKKTSTQNYRYPSESVFVY